MNKLLMTAAALFVVGGVTTVLADVSISGNSRFRYHAWSDDAVDTAKSGENNNEMAQVLEVWFNADETADTGMSYGAGIRLRSAKSGVDRNYVYIKDDWGQIKAGQDWAPIYNMSLAANWRGAVSGAQYVGGLGSNKKVLSDSYLTTSGKDLKLAYYTPDLSGLMAGFSLSDGGAKSKGDSTSGAIKYNFDVAGDVGVTLGYGFENQKVASGADNITDTKLSAMGVVVTSGDWTVAANKLGSKKAVNDNAAKDFAIKNSKQTAREIQVVYAVSDGLKLSYINLSSKENEGANKGDKFSSNELGLGYTIAPGLSLNVNHNIHKFDDANSEVKGKDGDNKGASTRVELRMNF